MDKGIQGDVEGVLKWSQYAIPLPAEHEHHYTKSPAGPLHRLGQGKVAKVDANYLLDKDNQIVGFEYKNKKFIFTNVINNSGNILPTARFKFERSQIDEVIIQCLNVYEHFKVKQNTDNASLHNAHVSKPLDNHTFTKATIEPLSFEAPDVFTKLPGKEYGMRKQTHRGATFLENKDRGLIGFRYHGKDFFIDIENKLLKRYKPELAFMHNDIEDIEKAIDQHLAETNLGLSDQPSTKEVKETKDILHNASNILHGQYQGTVKNKEYLDSLVSAYKESNEDNIYEQQIHHYGQKLAISESLSQHLENKIKDIENDIESLSKALPSLDPHEIKQQKELLNKLKKLSMNVLSQVSKTNDMETLYTQYQKLQDIDHEIEAIEKSIAEDQAFEFVDHPDYYAPEINQDNINQSVENLKPSTKQGALHNFYQRILNLIGSIRNALRQVLESINPLLRKKNTSNDEELGITHEKP